MFLSLVSFGSDSVSGRILGFLVGTVGAISCGWGIATGDVGVVGVTVPLGELLFSD